MNKAVRMIAATLMLACATAQAKDQAVDQAADDKQQEALDKRLADAQKRLESAAREIAELSAEAGASADPRRFQMYLPSARRAMLGVNLGDAEANGGGVRVNGVSPGGPAAEAGVKAGDVIVAIENKPVKTSRELVAAMEDIEPGQKVALDLRRDGKPVKVAVEARKFERMIIATPGVAVGALPAIEAMPAFSMQGFEFGDGPHWVLDEWGDTELVTLTPGLGRYFGAEKGVLVARAAKDSTLGLQDGDVIVAIGGREPENSRHAMRILRSYQSGESVELKVLRDRRAQTLSAKVPEGARHDVLKHREVLRHKKVAPPAPPAPPPPPKPAGSPTSS